AGGKGAAKNHLLGILADIDKAAAADNAAAKAGHIDVPLFVRLGQAQKGQVNAPAVVIIELDMVFNDGLRIVGMAEIRRTGRNAPDGPRFRGQVDHLRGALFRGYRGYLGGYAYAQIDNGPGNKLHG